MQTITLKDYPQLRDVVRLVSSGYRKHKAFLTDTDTVTPSDTYWSGGSVRSYYCVNNGSVSRVPAPTAPPQFNGGKYADPFAIPPGGYVVSIGSFCGKTAIAHIYRNRK